MVERNANLAKLQAGYLFPEVSKRKEAFLKSNPGAKLINLGIGDTTEPLTPFVSEQLQRDSKDLGTREGYKGYGPCEGHMPLRERIAEKFYHGKVSADEIFISDGAKCDMGRLQLLFSPRASIAIQDPAYPVYVDTSVMMGRSGHYNAKELQYHNIVYMPCSPENGFFPDLNKLPRTDIIYFCSPNNPTGAVATKAQLTELVKLAIKNKSIILFDAAYASYIQDPALPRSIYEIEGASKVAIEVNSFSKLAGFTGLRLGWSVVPKELRFDDGTPIYNDWQRIACTFFNGPSILAQLGGLAVLDDKNKEALGAQLAHYMGNAQILREGLRQLGVVVYGGDNAPFLWAHFAGRDSWEVFEDLLKRANIVTTPGAGFGAAGQGFIRLTAFGTRSNIQEAVTRLKNALK